MRRAFLLSIAAASCLMLGLSERAAAQAGSIYVREDIRTFSRDAAKVAKLRKAVAALQARPKEDARSWRNMANIHGYPGSLPAGVPEQVTSLYAQCHKKEELFFLWHRAYVWSLERLLQDAIADPTFRLPYWDWYSDPVLPEIFRSEWLDPQRTKPNPLYVADRKAAVNAGRRIWNPDVVTDYRDNQFRRFQDNLNFSEHGTIHMAIGTSTNMSNPRTAARDPIFWLHHANIDRLLPVWKKIGAQHTAVTIYPEWRPETYRFPSPQWTLPSPATVHPSISDLALNSSGEMMGYKYEKTDLPAATLAQLPGAPPITESSTVEIAREKVSDGVEVLAASGNIEIGAGGTVQLAVTPPAREKLMQLTQPRLANAPETQLTIVISGIGEITPDENVLSYRVFLNLPASGDEKGEFHDHFIGSISLFHLAHGSGDEKMAGMPQPEFRFDATRALSAAVHSAKAASEQISISIVPVLAPEAEAPKASVIRISEIRLESSAASEEPDAAR